MNQRALLLWIGGFIGVGLLYAAYKGQLNPIQAVTAVLQSKAAPATVSGSSSSSTPLTNGVSPAPAVSTTVPVTSGLIQVGDTWYTSDQYGNALTPISGVYQALPNNYIPNTGTVNA
jgi:hypothetical protein